MDSRTVSDQEVQRHIEEIKAYMPETYKAIQAKAQEIGRQAFSLVKRGLRGERDRFWAMERGWVKGTPFGMREIQADVALAMVQFGSAYVCIFGVPTQGENHGAN